VNPSDAVRETERELAAAGVPDARVDAELLVAHVLGVPRSRLTEPNGLLGPAEEAELRALAARRAGREPLQYVLGEWGFRRLTLAVDRRALIPRPETEVLVDRCLALLEDVEAPRILDVGTGSGAIALALADEVPDATVVGVDASAEALALAAVNAERTGFAPRVELRLGNLLEPADGTFDLVVSNPPYVPLPDRGTMQPEIVDWEPDAALFDRGQTAEIVDAAAARLGPGAALALELADGSAARVREQLEVNGYVDIRVTRDFAGIERVVEARRP
jgi:release factor glutamine methyltransferase